jgi:sec-independent protein translocase protein TatB
VDLSAAKILVVLVVALMVLGPDRLPQAARQAGRYAHELRKLRDGLHAEVNGAFGDVGQLSSLPGKGHAWMDSVTAEVLASTSSGPATSTGPGETPTPQGGPTPGDAPSQAPPGSGPVAEVIPPAPVTGVAPDDPDGSRLNRKFN